MDPLHQYRMHQTRRQFFGDTGLRLGGLALGWLLGNGGAGAAAAGSGAAAARVHPPLDGMPHFPPRAR